MILALQIKGRLVRHGQMEHVYAFQLMCTNTVESLLITTGMNKLVLLEMFLDVIDYSGKRFKP